MNENNDIKLVKKDAAENESHYGEELKQKLLQKSEDDLNDFEKFVLKDGSQYPSANSLRAGYDRYWKYCHEVPLDFSEYLEEVQYSIEDVISLDETAEEAVYQKLTDLYRKGRIRGQEIYQFAHYHWCRDPKDLTSYKTPAGYVTNNCCRYPIPFDTAAVLINQRWGFEVSQIGFPDKTFFKDTNYQCIRFDCRDNHWLWAGNALFLVLPDEDEAETTAETAETADAEVAEEEETAQEVAESEGADESNEQSED